MDEIWDILIIGGGITGAGIFSEASRLGKKVLLVEQKDFAWGTSSRSSKMIHGGLRYLLQGDLFLTWHSAREREYLMKKYPKLIEPLSFLLPIYEGQFPGKKTILAGLMLYDFLAWHKNHSFWEREKVVAEVPQLKQENLIGAAHFFEATTDDAALVLRLIQENMNDHAHALNYTTVKTVDPDKKGAVLQKENGEEFHIRCHHIINATGVFASEKIRPLRGSHLIFPQVKLPLHHSVTIFHPEDKRPIFAYPWKGATLVGTTDLDYQGNLLQEPSITREEVDYLLKGLEKMFPGAVEEKDILSTFSGLRPVVSSGKKKKPSQERRDSAIWFENGILTVTGGKLTTFRLTAHQALKKILPAHEIRPLEHDAHPTSFEEDRYFAVVHLEDLMLRRTRWGLTEQGGGIDMLPQVKKSLHWSEEKWRQEESSYRKLWKEHYSV